MYALLALFVGFGLIHLGNGVVHRFEREAAADLASRLRGGQKVVEIRSSVGPEVLIGEVHAVSIGASHFQTDSLPLHVEPKRSHRGILDDLQFHMRDFDLGALHVARLDADIPDCRFDLPAAASRHLFRLSESGTGRAEAEITAADLTAFVRHKYPALQSVQVTIDRDKVILKGRGVFFMTPADFWIAASVEAPNGVGLRLVHARMILNGRVADSTGAANLVGLFNPILDLDRDLGLNGAVAVDRLELRGGVLKAFGTVKIPEERPTPRPAL